MSNVTAVPIPPVKRSYLAWLWLGIAAAIIGAVLLSQRGTAESVALHGTNDQFLAWNSSQPGVVTTSSGLEYKVLKQGEGALPRDSDVAGVMYVGKLRDGTVFDAPQQPVPFHLQEGAVIPGFLEGMKLMREGARYRFWMKPELGYGDRSPDPSKIPNGSLLVFDVDMIGFMPSAMFDQIQAQQAMAGAQGNAPQAQ